jgi:alkanesulfonate monooxygenase SsuD/methylene tetrahydromethanopterin reductase-like flavin-dependent oxidoreductase (luciferase family)
MFLYVTEDRATERRIIPDVLAPALRRPMTELRERLLVGPVEECARKLAAYRSAGVQRTLLWPIGDELHQLETFQDQIVPLVRPSSP